MQDHLLDEKLRQRAKDESLPLPEDYEERVFSTCAGLPEHPAKKRRAIRWQAAAVAALAVFLAVPNLSASAAAAMERVPLLGSIVRVITVRSIYYGGGHGTAEVTVPEIQGDSSAAGSVNRDVQAYTDRLLTQFQEDCKTLGEGYESLDVSYDVLTDSNSWFTLRVNGLQIMASGYEFSRIYNIDKQADRIVALKDLFQPDSDWAQRLTEEIRRQMAQQMEDPDSGAVYFTEDWEGVRDDQNYYFDADGRLVLAFDEYEIAPGAMGAPEFTIPDDVWQEVRQ